MAGTGRFRERDPETSTEGSVGRRRTVGAGAGAGEAWTHLEGFISRRAGGASGGTWRSALHWKSSSESRVIYERAPRPSLPAAKWQLRETLSSFSGVEYWATLGEGVPAGRLGVVAARSNLVPHVGWPAPWTGAGPSPTSVLRPRGHTLEEARSREQVELSLLKGPSPVTPDTRHPLTPRV